MLTRKFLITDDRDNVGTAVQPVAGGEVLEITGSDHPGALLVKDDIPFGHKFALRPIPAGGPVVKYGEVIGAAVEAICAGDHVHVHNMEGLRGRGDRS